MANKHYMPEDLAELIRKNKLDELKSALNKDNIHAVTDGKSSLMHTAAEENNPEAMKILHDAGLSYDLKDSVGNTPLHIAALHDFKESLDHIIKGGGHLNIANNQGKPALLLSIEAHQVDSAGKLIDAGADVNFKLAGTSILHEAIEWYDKQKTGDAIINKVIEKGGDVSMHAEKYHMDTLTHAMNKLELDVAKKLVDNKAPVDGGGGEFSPLQIAVQANKLDMVKYFLDHGANPDTVGSVLTSSPLTMAVIKGSQAMADIIMSKGGHADIGQFNEGQKALYDIVLQSHPDYDPASPTIEINTNPDHLSGHDDLGAGTVGPDSQPPF